jgi:transposase
MGRMGLVGHGQTPTSRHVVGRAGAPVATAAAAPERRAAAASRPGRAHGHPVRAPVRPALGDAAPGDGLRLGHDLLAPRARLAAGGGLGAAASRPARSARPGQRDRLAPVLARCGERPGKKGGERTGPNPTDRGRPGSKRHLLVDAGGIPLAVALTPANVHDSRMLAPVLDAVTPIRQCRGRPRRRPGKLHADKAYDFPRCRRACHERRIVPRIARRGLDTSERLGRHRWVVERTFAWVARLRRLVVRYEQRADIFEAFHHLAAAMICCRFVERWFC